jgi:Tol biopolymer transport system component
VSLRGGAGDLDSYWPVISGDGSRVAFNSEADDLVNADTNGKACTHVGFDSCGTDVFVVERRGSRAKRVSVDSSGRQQAIGGDGAGNPTSNGQPVGGAISLSWNARYAAFASYATNLVPGEDTNATYDVFVHDLGTGATVLASVTSRGGRRTEASIAPVLSGDGSVVGFSSSPADDLSSEGYGTYVHRWR